VKCWQQLRQQDEGQMIYEELLVTDSGNRKAKPKTKAEGKGP
jgi:hypothetical protein